MALGQYTSIPYEFIGETLQDLNIKFIKRHKIGPFTVDYFLPDLNVVLEYYEPEYFYPLQTQLTEFIKYKS